jgi:hypothetical protein
MLVLDEGVGKSIVDALGANGTRRLIPFDRTANASSGNRTTVVGA